MPLHAIGPLDVLTFNQRYTVIIFVVHLKPAIVVPTNEISIMTGKTSYIRHLPAEPVIPGPFGPDAQMACSAAGPASSTGIIITLVINMAAKAPPPECIRNKPPFSAGRLFYG